MQLYQKLQYDYMLRNSRVENFCVTDSGKNFDRRKLKYYKYFDKHYCRENVA